jgi:DNA-directed RNA polymerase subunit L
MTAIVKVKWNGIKYTPEIQAALDELMGVDNFKMPFASEHVEITLNDVDVSVANAIRRTVIDEMSGYCLSYDISDFKNDIYTDLFMDPEFIRLRVRGMKIMRHMPKELLKNLKFAINIHNKTDEVRIVYAKDLLLTNGKLESAIFNPTYELAFVQPGRTLNIQNIRFDFGKGIYNASFNNACRSVSMPLDIEEYPREEIYSAEGSQRVLSGFKISTLIANPRKFLIKFDMPAVLDNGGKTTYLTIMDVCMDIMSRLQYIQRSIEESQNSHQTVDTITFIRADVVVDGVMMKKFVVNIKNETDTIGGLLARTICNLNPDISCCYYSCIDHEKIMSLKVRNEVTDPLELETMVIDAIKQNIATFTAIKKDVQALIS